MASRHCISISSAGESSAGGRWNRLPSLTSCWPGNTEDGLRIWHSQEANLFYPAALGRLGVRRLSDIIQERKRATVDRLHESPMELRVVVTAMINRARRHAQLGDEGKHVDLWATSLLEYASLGGLTCPSLLP